MIQEKKYLKEIKLIIEKELGLEIGDMEATITYTNGKFIEYKLIVKKSNDNGFFVTSNNITTLNDKIL